MKPFHGKTERFKNAPVCPVHWDDSNDVNQQLASNLVCPVVLEDQPLQTLPDIESSEAVVQFLDNYRQKSANESKFFIAFGLNKPHIPLKFPKQFLELYPFDEIELTKDRDWPTFSPLLAFETWSDLRTHYDVKELNLSFPFDYIPDHFQVR